jgi:Na+/H+-dicarboxylate symporter
LEHHVHPHAHQNRTLIGRFFHFLHSGPGVLVSAAFGLYVGVNWPLGDIPEQFQLFYTSLYRMMALPFLILTIIFAISRIKARNDERGAGLRVTALMASAMIVTAALAILVSSVVVDYESDTIGLGLGSVVSAFGKNDTNFAEVTLNSQATGGHISLLAEAVTNLVPSNVFSALSAMNLGQIIIFLIIFSVAILRLSISQRQRFISLVGTLRRPFGHMMERMQMLVPFAVFFYAVHAAHAVSAKNLQALRPLFGVILASTLIISIGAILVTALASRRSPFRVAADLKNAILAGILAVTEEASLVLVLEKIRENGSEDQDDQEVVASLGLAIGRFGMITILASVLIYTVAVYQVPVTAALLFNVLCLSIMAAVLITGLNGPGVLAAALMFCGGVLGLPLEALLVLVIILEPLLEILLIPVSVTVTTALVVLMTAVKKRQIKRSESRNSTSNPA